MHPLDSARERLRRADQNIQYLNGQIRAFLSPAPVVTWEVQGGEPLVTDENHKAFEELKKFIKSPVDLRFSVLAGEIIHHLRSAFDHLTWQLSTPASQTDSAREIEFPVLKDRPNPCGLKKTQMCSYCRKIQGILSPTALARIERLQPYWGSDPLRHPLWLIHDMDIFDKHRDLKLTVFIAKLDISGNVQVRGVGQQMPWELKPRSVLILDNPQVDMKAKMSAQITFSEFSGRNNESIIPTLQNFLSFTVNAIESFAGDF